MNGNDDRQDPARKLCTPRPQTEQANKQWFIEQSTQINPIPLWRWSLSQQENISTLMPLPQPNQHFLNMGISVHLIDFPSGFKETDLANYDQIVDAFSHCFYPGLFDALNMPDPYAAWPYEQTYWDNLFKRLSPKGFLVNVFNSHGALCLGKDGDAGRSCIEIYDCTGAPDIFHEIGHVVMLYGILDRIRPLYYDYWTSGGNNGIHLEAINELNRLFGNYTQQGKDIDGLKFGFVSDYALKNKDEDFADTFKYYVYFPDEALPRATRQLSQGSSLLSEKLSYISYLFKGMTFSYGGVVDNWPGYPL